MAFEHYLIFLTVSLLPALSPGPGMLLALSNSLRYGPKATLYSAIGNSLGLLLLGFAVAFGLAAILAISALAFTILKVLGAAYLVYLGVKLWRDGKSLSLADTDQGRFNPHWLLQQGFLVSITNPKAIILLAALIPPFVDHTQAILPQVTVMSVSYAITCFIIHLLLAQAGGRIRVLLSSAWRRKAVQRGLGSMFIGFGLALTAANR